MTRLKRAILVLIVVSLAAIVVAAAGAAVTSGPTVQGTPSQGGPQQEYTMEQTLSDQAQESTIAFSGLEFLTGNACCDTFLPPGKVADYAGFQYLRDNDATGMGHNTDFVTRAVHLTNCHRVWFKSGG